MGATRKGRPKRKFSVLLIEDMRVVGVNKVDADDRVRQTIHCNDPLRKQPWQKNIFKKLNPWVLRLETIFKLVQLTKPLNKIKHVAEFLFEYYNFVYLLMRKCLCQGKVKEPENPKTKCLCCEQQKDWGKYIFFVVESCFLVQFIHLFSAFHCWTLYKKQR